MEGQRKNTWENLCYADDDVSSHVNDHDGLPYHDCALPFTTAEPQQQLYVRLFLRKHHWIRASKLSYKDIADNLRPVIDSLVVTKFLVNGKPLKQSCHVKVWDSVYIGRMIIG